MKMEIKDASTPALDRSKQLLSDINDHGVSGLMEHGEFVTSLIQVHKLRKSY
jgi:hypothetical protein